VGILANSDYLWLQGKYVESGKEEWKGPRLTSILLPWVSGSRRFETSGTSYATMQRYIQKTEILGKVLT